MNVLSVINMWNVIFSYVIVLELGKKLKSSGLIYICLRKLLMRANLFEEKPDLKCGICDIILMFNLL